MNHKYVRWGDALTRHSTAKCDVISTVSDAVEAIMNQIHPPSTLKTCFSKIPSSNVASLCYVPNIASHFPSAPLLYKTEWGIFMSEHFAFPVPIIVPPMLHNEYGLRSRCSEWLRQVLDNPEIVIRCPAEETYLLHRIQAGFGAHSAFYSMVKGSACWELKRSGRECWSPIANYCRRREWVELYLHFPHAFVAWRSAL